MPPRNVTGEREFEVIGFNSVTVMPALLAVVEALAHAAAKRDLVAAQRPVDWEPPSILRPPEVLTEAELAAAEAELRALQRHAFEVVDPESR